MYFINLVIRLLVSSALEPLVATTPLMNLESRHSHGPIKPKVFLIDMVSSQRPHIMRRVQICSHRIKFISEAEIWYGIPEFNLLAKNITVPGLSPLFPDVHCTANDDVCQLVTGEAGWYS